MLYQYGPFVSQAAPFVCEKSSGEIIHLSRVNSERSLLESQAATRVFLQSDLGAISDALDRARTNGQDFFKSFTRELKLKRQSRMQSAEIWEAWDQAGGLPDLRELFNSLNKKNEACQVGAKIHAPKATKVVGSDRKCCFSLQSCKKPSSHLGTYNMRCETTVLKEPKTKKETKQTALQEILGKSSEEFVQSFKRVHTCISVRNAPLFATQLLIRVRQQFIDDQTQFKLGSLNSYQLKLQDMKWVYNEKIRPNLPEQGPNAKHTLFLCKGKSCANSDKRYSFEGIISHFSSMHTPDFRSGKTVVAWLSANWPEDPPFQVHSHLQDQSNGRQAPYNKSAQLGKGKVNIHVQRPFSVPAPPPQGYLVSPGPHSNIPWASGLTAPSGPPPTAEGVQSSFPGQNFFGSYPVSPVYTGQPPFSGPVAQSFSLPAQSAMVGSHALQAPYHGPSVPTPVSNRTAWSLPQFSSSEPTFPPPSTQPIIANFHQSQMDEVAHIAIDIWTSLSRVKVIPPSVRMHVIIHQVVSQFQKRFSNEPNLDLFIECVNNRSMMRPMKDVNGLACKTCVDNNESHEGPQSLAFLPSSGGRKLYSFSSLLFHFQSVHVQELLDWKNDMIELPDVATISGLKYLTGMDSLALGIIGNILQDALPHQSKAVLKRKPDNADDLGSTRTTSEAQSRYGPLLVERPRSGIHGLTVQDPPHAMRSDYPSYQGASRAFDVLYEEPRHFRDDQYDPSRPTFINLGQHDPTGTTRGYLRNADRPPFGFNAQSISTQSSGIVRSDLSNSQSHVHGGETSPKRIKLESSEEQSFTENRPVSGFHVGETPVRYFHSSPMAPPMYMNTSGAISEGPAYPEEPQDYIWIKRARPGA